LSDAPPPVETAHCARSTGRWTATLEHLTPADLAPPPPSYSHVIRARGDWTVYVAGQVAVDADGALVAEGDRLGQLERALANVETALAAAGAGRGDVVRLTI
jgi:enamine deaminase RidA (YjgF/YER057c/UK114 family)